MEEKIITHSKESEDISLAEIISVFIELRKYLLSKWIIIVSISLLGGILGFTYSYLKKPIYTATTSFVLEDGDKGGGMGQYAGLASMVGIDVGGGSSGIFQGDNILGLYKSRTMIEKTLLTEVDSNGRKQLLIDYYITFNGLKEQWNEIPELKELRFSALNLDSSMLHRDRLKDSILGVIVSDISKNYLKVDKPDKKLSLIITEVKAPDEFFAKVFNDQIVKKVNDFYVQTKTKKSLENVFILQQKVDSVRSAMNGSIYAAAAINDATPNLNPTRQLQRVAPVQRSQFSVETNKAILSELVKNLELSKISLRKEVPLIQVIDQPIFPLQKEKFGKLKGIILGSLLFGFLTVFFLSVKRFLQNVIDK
ncbi:Wzz/FepE/Etk N-terminal domain-containing protein [Pedobacter cryoconitis]|uniref:Subunit length determinant protein n=1 Tax=Pedobacter cryoconitis TaxID=188932 RepID=A0A327SX28_9SPHI|nr:Wzz/FepE/Etk N-terminal domain-containing protein [Pedobacter cryoconitis]RAJ33479.1 subunit length determinant protein [Pedobacter cryoconitis]